MATHAIGTVSSSDTGYFAARYSAKLYAESTLKNPVFKILNANGVINIENQPNQEKGGTVTLYNSLRRDSQGELGDVDRYSTSIPLEFGNRTLNIALVTDTTDWLKDGSQTQQYTSFNIPQNANQAMVNWAQGIQTYSVLNQLGGNTATSISAPSLSQTAYSGSKLTIVTGNNAALAPSSAYYAWGNNNDGGISDDANIDSSNPLTLRDFQNAREVITSQASGRPTWNCITGKPYEAVAFVSVTGMNQLRREAVTQGQGFNIPQISYAMMAGGKDVNLMEYVWDGFLMVEVPDSWLPRGVSSSASVANTRRAIICGANALDLAMGRGYTAPTGQKFPGFNVTLDDNYKKNNKRAYLTVDLLWGCKKAQITGAGEGTSTAYDNAVYVIGHYSAT